MRPPSRPRHDLSWPYALLVRVTRLAANRRLTGDTAFARPSDERAVALSAAGQHDALQAAEGLALFCSHSMDGGVSFHAPVPSLYGERLGRTSVAADGDFVVVGFEDSEQLRPGIGLALPRTMGHIFEQRIVPVPDDNGLVMNPLTAVRGRRRIAVAWEAGAADAAPATLIVRTAALR